MRITRITRRSLSRALLVASAPALMGFSERSYVYRYRLTLEVETPEGLKSGSSIVEVSAVETPGMMHRRLKGEAVAVDLGARGVLFALLVGRGKNGGVGSPDDPAYLPARVAVRTGKLKRGRPEFPILSGQFARQGGAGLGGVPLPRALSRH